jgi:hypothetical protein
MPIIATVIESESYQRAAAQYGDARLMDEIKESFDYVLANDPYYGERLPGSQVLYIFRTTSFYPRAPAFRVLYRYDPEDDINVVELLSIEPVVEFPF